MMMMMINTEADIVDIVCLTVGQRRPVLWTSLATDHLATYLANDLIANVQASVQMSSVRPPPPTTTA